MLQTNVKEEVISPDSGTRELIEKIFSKNNLSNTKPEEYKPTFPLCNKKQFETPSQNGCKLNINHMINGQLNILKEKEQITGFSYIEQKKYFKNENQFENEYKGLSSPLLNLFKLFNVTTSKKMAKSGRGEYNYIDNIKNYTFYRCPSSYLDLLVFKDYFQDNTSVEIRKGQDNLELKRTGRYRNLGGGAILASKYLALIKEKIMIVIMVYSSKRENYIRILGNDGKLMYVNERERRKTRKLDKTISGVRFEKTDTQLINRILKDKINNTQKHSETFETDNEKFIENIEFIIECGEGPDINIRKPNMEQYKRESYKFTVTGAMLRNLLQRNEKDIMEEDKKYAAFEQKETQKHIDALEKENEEFAKQKRKQLEKEKADILANNKIQSEIILLQEHTRLINKGLQDLKALAASLSNQADNNYKKEIKKSILEQSELLKTELQKQEKQHNEILENKKESIRKLKKSIKGNNALINSGEATLQKSANLTGGAINNEPITNKNEKKEEEEEKLRNNIKDLVDENYKFNTEIINQQTNIESEILEFKTKQAFIHAELDKLDSHSPDDTGAAAAVAADAAAAAYDDDDAELSGFGNDVDAKLDKLSGFGDDSSSDDGNNFGFGGGARKKKYRKKKSSKKKKLTKIKSSKKKKPTKPKSSKKKKKTTKKSNKKLK